MQFVVFCVQLLSHGAGEKFSGFLWAGAGISTSFLSIPLYRLFYEPVHQLMASGLLLPLDCWEGFYALLCTSVCVEVCFQCLGDTLGSGVTVSRGNFNFIEDRLFAPGATSFIVTPKTTFEGSSFPSLILGRAIPVGKSVTFLSVIDLATRGFPAPVRIGDGDLGIFLEWKRFSYFCVYHSISFLMSTWLE